MKDISIIAHRGANRHRPENSLAAFEKALEFGAHVIETDVRATRDGHAILMHDDTVKRTTGGVGAVAEMSLEDIKSLKLGNGQDIPTVREALELLRGRCLVNLELKDPGSVAAAGEIVREMKLWKEVIFSSFSGPWLVDLKLRYPNARLSFISDDRKQDCVRIASSLKAESVNIHARIATKQLVLHAHSSGLDVNVWTVNSPRRIRKLIVIGADGIISDKPDVARRVLESLRAEYPSDP
jgi:glycerophosphoryl diester phosphodiesterase